MNITLKALIYFLFITSLVPFFWIYKSLSVYDFFFTFVVVYLLSNKVTLEKNTRMLTIIFIFVLFLTNNISFIFSDYVWSEFNYLNSLVVYFRLSQMMLFLLLVSNLEEDYLIEIKKIVYYVIISTLLLSVAYTLLVLAGIINDEKAISIQFRISSFFGNANGYGYFLLYAYLTNYYFTSNYILRISFSFLIILLIITTGSFSTMLLLFLLYILNNIKVKNFFFLIISSLFIAIILYLFYDIYSNLLPSRITALFNSESFSLSDIGTSSTRLGHILEAIEIIFNDFFYFLFFGLGLGNTNIFIDNDSMVAPHNAFINLYLMVGLFSTITFAVLIWYYFYIQFKNSEKKIMLVSYFIVFLGYFNFSPIAYLPEVYIPLVLAFSTKTLQGNGQCN